MKHSFEMEKLRKGLRKKKWKQCHNFFTLKLSKPKEHKRRWSAECSFAWISEPPEFTWNVPQTMISFKVKLRKDWN